MLTVNGMEFDYVQPLDFLLDDYGLHGFGFTANTTILDQSSSGAAPAFATGVPPFSYNLTGYYDNNGVRSRLSYVWNDKTYASASNTQSLCLPNCQCPGGGMPARRLSVQRALWPDGLLVQLPALEPAWRSADRSGSHLRHPEPVPGQAPDL